MRTATLTFHASHNYGSMLQAYALQQTMISIFGDNEIINFRSPRQKKMMRVISMRPHLGPILKDITHLFYYNSLRSKHKLFEKFMNSELKLSSEEIPTVRQKDLKDYDLVCCGSDQIWNPWPEDFDLAYLLPFKIRAKKISYAASMGPGSKDWPEPISRYPDLLRDFRAISVREVKTRETVCRLSGRDDVQTHCDPVFLLDKKRWQNLIDSTPIINGKYIFLYTLFANPLTISCAKALSRKFMWPVVISNYTNMYDLFSPFKKHLAAGPKEFLNLIQHSEMVVTTSFHGTAFAILLNKPFVTINGMNDNRISNLLKIAGFSSRTVSSVPEMENIGWQVDFTKANENFASERQKSFDYLSQFRTICR